jgi:DNA invertase Pin-like site-specific DNA recombinase
MPRIHLFVTACHDEMLAALRELRRHVVAMQAQAAFAAFQTGHEFLDYQTAPFEGENMLDRPDGRRLLAEAREGDVVVIHCPARTFRNAVDYLEAWDQLERCGVRLLSMSHVPTS